MRATQEMAEAAFDRLFRVPRFEEVDVDLVRIALDCALAKARPESAITDGGERARDQVRDDTREEGQAVSGAATEREGRHGEGGRAERGLPPPDGRGIFWSGVTRWEDQPSATNDFGELCAEFRERLRMTGEPASPPDRLPVPGAAVRALVERWRKDRDAHVSEAGRRVGATLERCASDLAAALRADAAAAAPVPTREELAVMLASDADPGADPREQWMHAADVALAALARRPATDETEAVASVSVPQGDGPRNYVHKQYHEQVCDQLRAERDEAKRLVDVRTDVMKREKARADGLDAELKRTIEAANQNYAEAVEDGQKLRAELEKTRAELEAERRECDELRTLYGVMDEQHEALRTAVAVQDGPVEAVRAALAHYRDKVAGPHTRALYWAASKLLDAAALLKPAPAEAEPNWWRKKYDGEPVQHPPPESAMVEHTQESLGRGAPRFKPIYAKLDAVESTLRTFLADWARGSFNKARAAEVLEALDAREVADRG